MFNRRFTRASALAVQGAVEEASLRGDRRIGTEHLLLGLLHDPAAGPAAALGVDLAAGRDALHALDVDALQAVNVDPGDFRPLAVVRERRHRPFTSGAKAVLERTVTTAAQAKGRRIEPNDLLRAVLGGQPPDPALDVLGRLGIDPGEVLARLADGEAGAA